MRHHGQHRAVRYSLKSVSGGHAGCLRRSTEVNRTRSQWQARREHLLTQVVGICPNPASAPSKECWWTCHNAPAAACHLHPFAGNLRDPMPKGIVFNLVDYLQLVDWTGRCIREDKVGAIESHAEPILKRLSISPEHWVYLCTHFESRFKGLVGSAHSLKQACDQFGRQRIPNLSVSTSLFS